MDALTLRMLVDKLNLYTSYYDEGNPQISDKEWDKLYFQLVEGEKTTGIIYPDSPTQKINYQTVTKLEKIVHNHPMLSLDKSKNLKDIKSFINKPSYNEAKGWYGMFKMDGLTCSLTYLDGQLDHAETRGDGDIGEDITHNALIIPSIPKKIPNKELTVIDGEIICDLETFEKKFKDNYANPRNFAAGSIRQLSSKECAARNLTFIAWDLVIGCDDIDFNWWRLEKLDEWGFITVPRVGDAETVEDAVDILNDMKKTEYPFQIYPIDGYVFKFESKKYGESLGRTDHHFKNAIAYKLYDEEYETTLKYIDYDVSRNGILTPVAVFEPVEIDGSIVERASLYNISVMRKVLGDTPYCGQHIWVIKANQIIPQITKAVKMNYGDIIIAGGVTTGLGGDYGILCPICEGTTSIRTSESGVDILYCENEQCPGKLAQRIDYFCGKKGLDIKGLSRKTIEKLIDWGFINELKDIYNLEKYRTEWESKPGFGKASVGKILDAIDAEGRHPKFESFISAIGIPLIGSTVAKQIVKYYSTWEDFRNAVGGDWTEFEGFGPEISKAINSFNFEEVDLIAGMLDFAKPEAQIQETPTAALSGKTFCITGKVINYKNRDELKAEIESLGGKVASSVSSKTDYLINNDNTSTSAKNKKAKELGIEIITEEEYLSMKG